MLPLISLDDRIDLVISTDPAIEIKKGDREPCHALPKSKCKIKAKQPPLVIQIRPLSSRESLRLFSTGEEDHTGVVMRACELCVTAITGEGISASNPETIENTLDRIPFQVLGAVGSFIITESIQTEDPTRAA